MNKFKLESFLTSEQYSPVEKDLLKAVLDPSEKYSQSEVHKIINKLLKKEVD